LGGGGEHLGRKRCRDVEFGANVLESVSQNGAVDNEANPAMRHIATVCENRSCVGQAPTVPRTKRPPAWLIAAVAGAICVASRALPWHEAVATTRRVGPILLFLVAITVVAELADAAQVFDVAATRAAKLGRGRTWELFALIVVLGSLTTIVLSLDTTAVLLTPVVLALASQLRISVIPFAMAAVWLANTASLLLPVSNLTNLLAVNRLHLSAVSFAAKMWLPAIASIAVTAVVIGVAYR
jgi:arsenical pump membrane protein